MRKLLCALLVGAAVGCSGSNGASVPMLLMQLGNCSANGLSFTNGAFQGVADVISTIQGSVLANVTYDAGTGDYSVDIDLDGDLVVDGTVSGVVSSADNISDGIDDGESVQFTWVLTVGTTTGSGAFDFDRVGNTMNLSGLGSINDATCTFNVSDFTAAIDLLDPQIIGTLDFDLDLSGDTMAGTMTFDGSDMASVTATYSGIPASFTIDLNLFLAVF